MNIEPGPATESSSAKPAAEPGEPRMPEKSVRRLFVAARDSMARLSTTRANGQAGLVADVATSILLLCAGLWRTDIAPVAALGTILFGLLIFSFVEYFFHRWLFHGATQVMEQGHRKHHEQPLGYDALPFFLPPLGLLMLTGTLALFVPVSYACLLLGAMAAGYAAYGLSHAAIHNTRFRNPVSRRWAAAHHIHHCHPEKNFGVTTPLWDIVLGTRYVSTGKGLKPREMVVGTTDQ